MLDLSTLTPQDATDDEKRAALLAYIASPAKEIARLHAPGIARWDAQLAEAANATPDEIVAADAQWQAHKKAMNETRRENGERLLFREVEP